MPSCLARRDLVPDDANSAAEKCGLHNPAPGRFQPITFTLPACKLRVLGFRRFRQTYPKVRSASLIIIHGQPVVHICESVQFSCSGQSRYWELCGSGKVTSTSPGAYGLMTSPNLIVSSRNAQPVYYHYLLGFLLYLIPGRALACSLGSPRLHHQPRRVASAVHIMRVFENSQVKC